ncbi:MAG TPA: hypothetical protein VF807_10170 [Ktedonobacterales bacterium]
MHDPDLEITRLDSNEPEPTSAPARRWSRGALWRAGLGLCVALALLTVALTSPGVAQAVLPALPGYAPTPTAQARVILFRHAVPWGTLTIDGHPLTVKQFTVERASPGRHTLRYAAEPFPTLTCVFSVPASTHDTCPIFTPRPEDLFPLPPARVIDLGIIPQALPQAQRDALLAVIQRGLGEASVPLTVLSGDHYADAADQVVIASSTISATLTYQLRLTPPGSPVSGSGCEFLCSVDATDDSNWEVWIPIRTQWRLSLPTGEQIITPSPAGVSGNNFIAEDIAWDGSWQVSFPPSKTQGLECAAANTSLGALLSAAHISPAEWRNIPSSQPWECLSLVTPEQTPLASSTAFLLYRFGALLAANDEAHGLFPALPVASPHERILARQIAASGS